MNSYQRPALILSQTEHDVLNEEGKVVNVETWWEGSFRGPNSPGLENIKEFFEGSGLTQYTAGHANAGGVGVKDADLKAFRDYCNSALKDFDFTPKYKVDFIFFPVMPQGKVVFPPKASWLKKFPHAFTALL